MLFVDVAENGVQETIPELFKHEQQSPEVKFKFVFFQLQMLRFSALCGPNEQKFGELLT